MPYWSLLLYCEHPKRDCLSSLFMKPSRVLAYIKNDFQINEWFYCLWNLIVSVWSLAFLFSYFYLFSTILIIMVWTHLYFVPESLMLPKLMMSEMSHRTSAMSGTTLLPNPRTGHTHRSWALWFLIMAICSAKRFQFIQVQTAKLWYTWPFPEPD